MRRSRWPGGLGGIVAGALVIASTIVVVPRGDRAWAAPDCRAVALIATVGRFAGIGQSGTVDLTPGCTYYMSSVHNGADGPNALPDILGHVTIIGHGDTITRDPSSTVPFRYFNVDDGGSLSISDMTISGGRIAAGDYHSGGAILNRASLTVSRVTFTDNQSLSTIGGGAINNHDRGQMTVTGSTFDGNSATQGGAIENDATECTGDQTVCGSASVSDSMFVNNSTTQYGGGAFENQMDQSSEPVCPTLSPQTGTCQIPGGAVATLERDTFDKNTAATEGGAIANYATMSLTNSTITANSIAPSHDGGGGGIQNTGTVAVTQTTISGNSSQFGANVHTYDDVAGQPGPPVTTMRMSVVTAPSKGSSCGGTTAVTDGGYNLDSGSSCSFSAAQGSLSDTDPELAPLAANGGATPTMALVAGSPAIDAVPVGTPGCSGSTDQRGVTRPLGAGCDMGAFEEGDPPSPSPSPSPSVSPSASPSASPSVSPSASPSVSPSPSPSVSPSASPSPSVSPSASPSVSPSASPSPSPSPSSSASLAPSPTSSPAALPSAGASSDAGPAATSAADVATPTKRRVAAGRAHGVLRGRGARIVRTPVGPGILTTTRGSAITVRFEGDGIELHFRSDRFGGRVRITLDGHSRTFDLYASHATDRLLGWAYLGSGTHTVRITALGTHRTGSRGTRVLLAALRVLAT